MLGFRIRCDLPTTRRR